MAEHGSTLSTRDPLASHRVEWTLPSSRLEYVKNHPVTYLAELHSNEKMIAPIWGKVSKTAWQDRATLCSGYGTRMEVTRISVDAPQSFTDAHRAAKRCPRQAEVSYSGVDEAAYVLPAGQSILAATMKSREQLARSGGNKGYKIYTDGGKKGYLRNDPLPTPMPSARFSIQQAGSTPSVSRPETQRSRLFQPSAR